MSLKKLRKNGPLGLVHLPRPDNNDCRLYILVIIFEIIALFFVNVEVDLWLSIRGEMKLLICVVALIVKHSSDFTFVVIFLIHLLVCFCLRYVV